MIHRAERRAVGIKFIPVSLAILMLTAGCVIPLTTPTRISTADPNVLSTIIAGTAHAAGTHTAAAFPPTLTPGALPTETLTPTITSTPGAVFSAEGTILLPDENGSTLFIDQTAGYRLRVPPGWLLMRINEPEMTDAFGRPEASDVRMQNFLRQVQMNDPATFRLFGVEPAPRNFQSGFVTNFNVFWDPAGTGSLEQVIATLKDQMPRTDLNAAVTSAQVSFTSSRLPVGLVESSSTLLSSDGWPVNLFQKQAVFHLKAGILSLVLSTTQEQKNTYLPGFDAMLDQMVLIEQ